MGYFHGLLLGRGYGPEGFQTITSYCPETLSNVRRCWLAIPMGAGILCMVLAWFIGKYPLSFFIHVIFGWTAYYIELLYVPTLNKALAFKSFILINKHLEESSGE